MVALGVTAEAGDADITGNSLWPATIIEPCLKNFQMGQRDMWRTANIIADATVGIVCDDAVSGLRVGCSSTTRICRRWGLEDHHFVKYRPDRRAPRLLAAAREDGLEDFSL